MGNSALLLYWLLAYVPKLHHQDVRPYIAFWLCIAVLMLGTILTAGGNPSASESGRKQGSFVALAGVIAGFELVFAIYAMVDLGFFHK